MLKSIQREISFMTQPPDQITPKKRSLLSQYRLIVIGALLIWASSIGLALQLKTLFTPGNYPVGTDPSFDMSVAFFCFLALVLGSLTLWHGIGEREKRMEPGLEKLINTTSIFICALLAFNFITGAVLFSANLEFAASYVPSLRYEPTPDDAMATFAVPVAAHPTPTFDPTSKFMAGPVKSALSGLRVGDIWISLTPNRDAVRFVQVFMNRIQCNAQNGTTSGTFAVGESEQLINGPFQIQEDRTFFGAQDMAVIHGIIGTLDQGYGTIYLRYKDPATSRTCDLGSFEWTATLTGN
jgi:hypothetical protein